MSFHRRKVYSRELLKQSLPFKGILQSHRSRMLSESLPFVVERYLDARREIMRKKSSPFYGYYRGWQQVLTHVIEAHQKAFILTIIRCCLLCPYPSTTQMEILSLPSSFRLSPLGAKLFISVHSQKHPKGDGSKRRLEASTFAEDCNVKKKIVRNSGLTLTERESGPASLLEKSQSLKRGLTIR